MATGIGFVLVAWPLFAAAMPRHQAALLMRELPKAASPLLRVLAWGLLGVGLWAFIAARGASQGAIFWGATLVLSAIAWVLLLTFLPRRAVGVVLGLALVALLFP